MPIAVIGFDGLPAHGPNFRKPPVYSSHKTNTTKRGLAEASISSHCFRIGVLASLHATEQWAVHRNRKKFQNNC